MIGMPYESFISSLRATCSSTFYYSKSLWTNFKKVSHFSEVFLKIAAARQILNICSKAHYDRVLLNFLAQRMAISFNSSFFPLISNALLST